jgi:hypothetical protein
LNTRIDDDPANIVYQNHPKRRLAKEVGFGFACYNYTMKKTGASPTGWLLNGVKAGVAESRDEAISWCDGNDDIFLWKIERSKPHD